MSDRRPTERYVDVTGIKTRYYESGVGEPIILIHGGEPGGSAGADIWAESNFTLYSRPFRVIAPDRLGQGYTANPVTADDYRISTIGEHLASFLRVLDLKAATLVGQSRGALLAVYLAMHHPDLVRRLVLVNSASLAPGHRADIGLYRQLVKGTVASVHADAAALSVNLSHITEEWVTKVQRLRSQAKILDAMQVFNSIASLYYDDIDDHKVRLLSWLRDGKFGGPILIIWGIGDPMTSLADATDLFEVCAGSGTSQVRMYMLSDCGHYPFREYPTEFGSAITTFVETFD